MAGIFFRKTMMILFTILKWIFQAVFAALKLAFWIVKLFLLLSVLAVSGVSAVAGVTAGRQ